MAYAVKRREDDERADASASADTSCKANRPAQVDIDAIRKSVMKRTKKIRAYLASN